MTYIKMKKTAIILISIILLILTFTYLQNGQFDIRSSTSISMALLNKNISYYLGYGIAWDGPLAPTIRDIKFTDSNGKVILELEKYKDDMIYVDNGNHLGSAKAEDINLELLSSFRNYRLKDKNLDLAFKIDSDSE